MNGFKVGALAGALVLAAGFAPAATAHGQSRDSVVRLLDVARGSRIGVSVQDIEDADAKDTNKAKNGVIVESVEAGSSADKAGVKAGDAITEFDGEKVRSVRQFSRLVQETPSGRNVAMVLSRAGQRVNVTVTPESASFRDDLFPTRAFSLPRSTPPTPPAPRAPRPPSVFQDFPSLRIFSGRHLGMTLETLDDQLAQYFGVKEGVLVKSVSKDSVAEKAGLKAGDVITSFNGRKVYEATDVNRALDRMNEDNDEFTVEVTRDKKTMTLKGKMERERSTSRVRTRTSTF